MRSAAVLVLFGALQALASKLLHPKPVPFNPRAPATTVTETITQTLTECAATTTQSGNSMTSNAVTGEAATSSESPGLSNDVTRQGSQWVVAGVGTFDNRKQYTFTGSTLPKGLQVSQYTVDDTSGGNTGAKFNHTFSTNNVYINNGFLNLVVPGTRSAQAVYGPAGLKCAEVVTTESKIMYASVRTNAIFSSVPGTCQSSFCYHSDNQEIDIEFLSDPSSLSNDGPDNPIPIWYSNQAVIPGTEPSQNASIPTDSEGNMVTNMDSAIHEYRIDWTPDGTCFYLDGVMQSRFFDNVPTVGCSWIWNNWANGDPGWSCGPPQEDSVMQIQSIVMYYNTTGQ